MKMALFWGAFIVFLLAWCIMSELSYVGVKMAAVLAGIIGLCCIVMYFTRPKKAFDSFNKAVDDFVEELELERVIKENEENKQLLEVKASLSDEEKMKIMSCHIDVMEYCKVKKKVNIEWRKNLSIEDLITITKTMNERHSNRR